MHSQSSKTPFITLRGYFCNVIEQQVNYITKVTVATKGIILHMQYTDFVKGEHSPMVSIIYLCSS